jgi:predicted secreted protein
MKKLLFLFALLPVMVMAQTEKQDTLFGIMPEIEF